MFPKIFKHFAINETRKKLPVNEQVLYFIRRKSQKIIVFQVSDTSISNYYLLMHTIRTSVSNIRYTIATV